jgi:hypothetical protein
LPFSSDFRRVWLRVKPQAVGDDRPNHQDKAILADRLHDPCCRASTMSGFIRATEITAREPQRIRNSGVASAGDKQRTSSLKIDHPTRASLDQW